MKRAFTLIELLVVIAIIAILAAILFPVFAQAKLAAKQTASLSSVKQIGTSSQIYMGDYDDLDVPYHWWRRADAVYITWMEMQEPYVKNKDIFINPAQVNDANTFYTGCSSTSNPKLVSHYIRPTWIRYDYWNWFGTVMFAGMPILQSPLTDGTVGAMSSVCSPATLTSRPYAACRPLSQTDEPSNVTILVPGYFITYNRPAPAPEGDTKFGSACITGFGPDPLNQTHLNTIQVFRKGGNYALGDSHARWYRSSNMNANNSKPHNYGGVDYPSSPYMVVVN